MAGFVTPYYAGRLATLDSTTSATFSLMTSAYIPAMVDGHLSDVEEYEVTTDEAPGYERATQVPLGWEPAETFLRTGFGVIPSFNVAGASDIRHVVVTDDLNNDRIIAVLSWPEPRSGHNGFRPLGDDPNRQIIAAVVSTSGVEQIRAGTNITVDTSLPAAPEVSAHPERPGPWETLPLAADLHYSLGQGIRRNGAQIEVSASMIASTTGSLVDGQVLVELPSWAWPRDETGHLYPAVAGDPTPGPLVTLSGTNVELSEGPTGWVLRLGPAGTGNILCGWLAPLTWGGAVT